MKIALMTYYNNGSYGAALQAFALQRCLKKMGHEVAFISYLNQWPPRLKMFDLIKSRSPWAIYRKLLGRGQCYFTDNFAQTFFQKTQRIYQREKDLIEKPPLADVYICGSDQIWNPWTYEVNKQFDASYFLNFGSDTTRRIAYAPSFGRAILPRGFEKKIKPLLKRFDRIGVREKSAIALVQNLTGCAVSQVLDPTLLLSAEDYTVITNCSGKRYKGGGVYYILGTAKEIVFPSLQKLKKLINKRGSFISPPYLSLFGRCDTRYPSVTEWLKIISNADFVLTDSFHGVVFSILFERPFIVLQRAGGVYGRNDRLFNLLDMLGLQERSLQGYDPVKIERLYMSPIDWKFIRNRLNHERTVSMRFLNEALT